MFGAGGTSLGRGHRARVALLSTLATVIALGCLALADTSAGSAEPPSWGHVVLVDHRPPFADHRSPGAIACATNTLCVAVDDSGEVLASRRPRGGIAGWTPAEVIDSGRELTGLACPASNLCVAVDNDGDVLTTTNPLGGAAAWSMPVPIDPGQQ
jgi:hypothetical protein